MSKLHGPLFSFQATGGVGHGISFREGLTGPQALATPTHPDANTNEQQAARYNLKCAARWWMQLSPDEQLAYAQLPGDRTLSPYNLLVSAYLYNLLYLVGWWPMHGNRLPTSPDLSLYHQDGLATAPVSGTDSCGQDAGATLFDGVDDGVSAPAPELDFTTSDFSLAVRARRTAVGNYRVLACRGLLAVDGWLWILDSANRMYSYTSQLGAIQETYSTPNLIAPGDWATFGLSRDGPSITLYRDGVDVTQFHAVHVDPATSARPLRIGIYDDLASYSWGGQIHACQAYSRALSTAEHAAIHARPCLAPYQ